MNGCKICYTLKKDFDEDNISKEEYAQAMNEHNAEELKKLQHEKLQKISR